MEIFAKRLKELRLERNLSLRDIAEVLGIHHTSYENYEKDKSEPTQEMLNKIADFFGVTTDYLLGRVPI